MSTLLDATLNNTLAGDFSHKSITVARTEHDLLTVSVAVDRHLGGFISRDYADGEVYNFKVIMDYITGVPNPVVSDLEITEHDHEVAEKIREYFSGLIFKALTRSLTSFEKIVVRVIDQDKLSNPGQKLHLSSLGAVCSLPSIYRKNLLDDAWAIRENNLRETAGPEGIIGHRHRYYGEIVHLRKMTKTNSTLVVILTEKNNIVKFFRSSNRTRNVEEINFDNMLKVGNTLEFSGYVKRQCPSKVTKTFENVVNRVMIHDVQLPDK